MVTCAAADLWEAEAKREQGPMADLLREAAKLVRKASEASGDDISCLDNIRAAMSSREALVSMLRAWVLVCDKSPHEEDRVRSRSLAAALEALEALGQ